MIRSEPSHRRVVITGVSVISPLGMTTEALWSGLSSGRSGVKHWPVEKAGVAAPPFAGVSADFSGVIEDFGPLEGDIKKAVRKGLKIMCRESQMGVAAAQRALTDAGVTAGSFDPERFGAVFGTDYMLTDPYDFVSAVTKVRGTNGGVDLGRWATEGLGQMSPLWLLKYLPNMPASHLAIYNDFRGPNNSITLREAAGLIALGEAYRVIVGNRADRMVAGATGTRLHPMKTVHAVTQEQTADRESTPETAARPFDLHRTGMVLGEGAGAVVLEEYESAKRRGARIYGEVIGTASSTVADRNFVAGRSKALANVMRIALRSAQMSPDELGHLHAHGLGTRSADVEESRAVQAVFGERAKPLPVVAAKSYFGNLGAGSSVVELISSLLALEHNQLFRVLNYETPDPECTLSVVRSGNERPGDSFLTVNVTPQGQAAGILIRRAS